MISIVLLAFSGIALIVFSDGGAVKPIHTPHTDLQENINKSTGAVQIFHIGGDTIDLDELKVVLFVNGNKTEFNGVDTCVTILHPDGSVEPKYGIFTVGDCMEIDTAGKITFPSNSPIDIFVVHPPSKQVIQNTVIQKSSSELPYWISPYPYGSVYDSSAPLGWLPIELVGAIGDGLFTNSTVSGKSDSVYEEYEFGINADEMGISNPLKLVKLKIIYGFHDKSSNILKLEVSTDGGLSWAQIAPRDGVQMEEYKDKDGKNTVFDECIAANVTYDLTDYVKNTDKLEKLKVKFSVFGNPKNGKKYVNVDFVGLHVEA